MASIRDIAIEYGQQVERLLEQLGARGPAKGAGELLDQVKHLLKQAYALLNGKGESLSQEERPFARRLLLDAKILDPAVGSGAFLVGMLQTLEETLEALGEPRTLDLRKRLLQNLYGVDALGWAVWMTELRLRPPAGGRPGHRTGGERSRERVYRLGEFRQSDLFLRHIEDDLALLTQVYAQGARLHLVDPQRDPKALALARFLRESLEREPERKVVVFSEFTDTVEHLEAHLKQAGLRVLAVGQHLGGALMERVVLDFDTSLPRGLQRNHYDVLVTSDKLSEGVNLHRAGTVINYDIPWNPTRVIQRVGRINRIGQKVFDTLRIYHFFPTEQGSGVADPRRVAEHKLFLIHKALGEDAKVLSPDEKPSPAQVYERLTHLPEEEESFDTWVRLEWERIRGLVPGLEERIARLPNRVKTARPGEKGALLVARKGLGFYAYAAKDGSVQPISFPEALKQAWAEPATPRLELSPAFWEVYQSLEQKLLHGEPEPFPSNSLEQKAARNLRTALGHYRTLGEETRLTLVQALLRDILRYKRLPRYVLRRLAQIDLAQGEEAFQRFEEELQQIQGRFALIVLAEPQEGHQPELVVAVG